MKRLFVCLLLLFVTLSCSVSDDTSNTYSEILPVENATVPEEFEFGETYEIFLTYLRPTNCHAFNNIYYSKDANERTVAVVATVFSDNGNCVSNGSELEASFNFKATSIEPYVFKFWQGEDDEGEDQYLIVEVPVVD